MKSLIAWCLRRPVTVVAGCIFVVVLAAVAYVRLPVALLPDLRYPSLAVWTAYADVPPERVEAVRGPRKPGLRIHINTPAAHREADRLLRDEPVVLG